ncbi:MAG: ribosomal-protein-alanine N-acetyltransferase, partial [Microcoleus sp. SIO2G3]|nr:ribosomal-protein-alanine N-acetyltransferase [Microcoleus sp. SIO2G3]
MTFLELHPLTAADLSAVVELDELCFGGLWTRSGYERELESSSSQLLVLEARRDTQESGFPSLSSESFTQNLLKAEIQANPTSQKSLVGLGCYWSILEEAHI